MHEQNPSRRRKRILCGVDGSPTSQAAAQLAAELARVLDLELVMVHAVADPPAFPYGDARARELQRRQAARAGSELLNRTAATIPDVDHETQIVFGSAVEGLSALCAEDDVEMLVVGSRGRSGLRAALLGSVSARLASTAECPVIVIPPGEATKRLRARLDSVSAGNRMPRVMTDELSRVAA